MKRLRERDSSSSRCKRKQGSRSVSEMTSRFAPRRSLLLRQQVRKKDSLDPSLPGRGRRPRKELDPLTLHLSQVVGSAQGHPVAGREGDVDPSERAEQEGLVLHVKLKWRTKAHWQLSTSSNPLDCQRTDALMMPVWIPVVLLESTWPKAERGKPSETKRARATAASILGDGGGKKPTWEVSWSPQFCADRKPLSELGPLMSR